MPEIMIIRSPVRREDLRSAVLADDIVKAVVDCDRKLMAVGGDLHADEEQALLADGSSQENLWGINLHLDKPSDTWIAFDSMINIRPRQGNRSRSVEDPSLQQKMREVVSHIVQ